VACSADGNEQIFLAGEVYRLNHIVRARAAGDESRTPVDGGVKHCPRIVISVVARCEQMAAKARLQLLDGGGSNHDRASVRGQNLQFGVCCDSQNIYTTEALCKGRQSRNPD
jgi:hypothetical protein